MPARPALRRVAAVAVTVLLLAIGGAAILVTPSDDAVTAPIAAPGAVGHRIVGRELVVTVSGVRLARRVDYPTQDAPPATTTSGVWVLVDATVAGGRAETTARWSQLRLGGSTFTLASDAGISSLNSRTFAVGIPFRGSFVFEVSEAALAHATSAELVLRDTPDSIPDTQPVVRLDLSGRTVAPSAAVRDPEVVQR